MNDYKDLITRLKLTADNPIVGEAISAIETLVKERDAAVEDLKELDLCGSCKHFDRVRCHNYGSCYDCAENGVCSCGRCITKDSVDMWEWRGVPT